MRHAPGGGPDESVKSAVRRIWNENAGYWDSRMGEGNSFHRELLLPVLERLLAIRSGDCVLDVACGNGQLSRWMADREAEVLAVDVSEQMVEIAKSRTHKGRGSVEYRVLDASAPGVLEQLGHGCFDAIVCNMALMDMPDIAPLAKVMPKLLGEKGRFVFSVTHPCFNTSDMRRVASESKEGGKFSQTFGIEIRRYLTPRTELGFAMPGQPEAQFYFERPLNVILGAFLSSGLVMDALEEPAFPALTTGQASPWFVWENCPDIPPALIVRFIRDGRK